MASVRLDFTPPEAPEITELHIYEGPSSTGPWTQIEVVTEVGTYPDYITEYTTDQAVSATDWFVISWQDAKGASTPYSAAIQGGTTTLVATLVTRVRQRDATLNENVVLQTAEWVISKIMVTDNPYDAALSPTLDQLEGMTLLTLARSILHSLAAESSDDSYTAGLVSQRSGQSSGINRQKLVDYLLSQANSLLGISMTTVMLLQDIDPLGIGTTSAINYDQSRLAVTINLD